MRENMFSPIESAEAIFDNMKVKESLTSTEIPDNATGYFLIFTSNTPNEAYCATEVLNVPYYKRVLMFARLAHRTQKETDDWQKAEGLDN